MYYFVYRDVQNQWRWRLYAANYRIVAESGEGYYNRSDCINAIALVKRSASAPIRE
jgi:uncharacterized protein YegP (UPF0339 family)